MPFCRPTRRGGEDGRPTDPARAREYTPGSRVWVPFTDSRSFGLEEGSAAAALAAWNAEVTSGSDDLARRFFGALPGVRAAECAAWHLRRAEAELGSATASSTVGVERIDPHAAGCPFRGAGAQLFTKQACGTSPLKEWHDDPNGLAVLTVWRALTDCARGGGVLLQVCIDGIVFSLPARASDRRMCLFHAWLAHRTTAAKPNNPPVGSRQHHTAFT